MWSTEVKIDWLEIEQIWNSKIIMNVVTVVIKEVKYEKF